MGIHQGDPSRGALFILAHFMALHFTINHFPSCLFPSIANDIHIIGPPFNYIICIRTFPDQTSCNRSFYPT
jgi:hypothetical protein